MKIESTIQVRNLDHRDGDKILRALLKLESVIFRSRLLVREPRSGSAVGHVRKVRKNRYASVEFQVDKGQWLDICAARWVFSLDVSNV